MTKDINLEGLCVLEGRISIITGPAKGMGAAITLALANAGSDLVLVGRDLEPIKIVAQKVRKLGRKAKVVKCDITSDFDVSAMCKKALEFYGHIDILVNIAGGTGPLGMASWETTPKDFDQIIDLNLKGCFLTMREVLPTMIAQRYGKIVNVGGTFGLRGRALRMAYSASKWGLRGMTKSTASAQVWWMVHAFRKYVPNKQKERVFHLKKSVLSMNLNMRSVESQQIKMLQMQFCF